MEGDAIIMVPLLQQQAAQEEEQTTTTSTSTKKPELQPTVTHLNSNGDLYANLPLLPHLLSLVLAMNVGNIFFRCELPYKTADLSGQLPFSCHWWNRIRVRQPKLGELRVYYIAMQLLGP